MSVWQKKEGECGSRVYAITCHCTFLHSKASSSNSNCEKSLMFSLYNSIISCAQQLQHCLVHVLMHVAIGAMQQTFDWSICLVHRCCCNFITFIPQFLTMNTEASCVCFSSDQYCLVMCQWTGCRPLPLLQSHTFDLKYY